MGKVTFIEPKKNVKQNMYDVRVIIFDIDKDKSGKLLSRSKDKNIRALASFAKKTGFKFSVEKVLNFDISEKQRFIVAAISGKEMETFHYLKLGRKVCESIKEVKGSDVLINLEAVTHVAAQVIDGVCSALEVGQYETHKYKKGSEQAAWDLKSSKCKICFQISSDQHKSLRFVADQSRIQAKSTNLVRRLMEMAGNDLTCSRYVKIVKEMAKKYDWGYTFTSIPKLEKMGAGAFTAVTQASRDSGGGIVKLSYTPKKSVIKPTGKHLALVGKGITYDTGGVNLKPASYMYGMHGDMGGSAVALAIIAAATEEKWSFPVTAYLAIADNHINDKGYKPNDVVHSLSGKSIEIIHTDAEGRMILADTLALACQDGAAAILDFATLTGACMQAIGTTYSGAFTNRIHLAADLIEAGKQSGERIWPFPNDQDFGTCLESDVADIKQCRLRGGVDHIEAAHFLGQFVDEKVPWVHVDLAAAENDGGLGHVSGKVTGFGVRVGCRIAKILHTD